jgi:hypothetical protein
MRERITQILEIWGNHIRIPTQEQIDRSESVAIKALGPKIHEHLTGSNMTIAMIAILMNRDWIMDTERTE